MSKYIYNISGLEEAMKKKAHDSLAEVAETVLEEWKMRVKQRVYEQGKLKANPNNNYYERTNQLLESLELQWIDPLTVTIGYNTEKILPSMMLNKYTFNRHTSFSGEDYSNVIPYFIECGNGNSNIHSYEGIHAMEEVIKILNVRFNEMLSKALKKNG